MIVNVYSVKDHLYKFGDPVLVPSDDLAVRYFSRLVNGDKVSNDLAFKPSDFDLFKIGTFDTDSAKFKQIWPVEFVVNGESCI